VAEAQRIVPCVVQNFYNIGQPGGRGGAGGDGFARHRLRAVLPAGGFSPLQSDVLESVASGSARRRSRSPSPGCWQRSPNVMLIPGTSSSIICARTRRRALALPPDAAPSWTDLSAYPRSGR